MSSDKMADFNMEGGYPHEGIRPTDPLGFLSSRSSAPITTSSILNVAPGSLGLSIEEQNSMIESIQNIFELEEEDQKEDEELLLQMSEMWGAYVGDPVTRQSLRFAYLEECCGGGEY